MARVSVIIPAYNAEKTVERAVRSVLSQTLRDIEVWVTDDGSTDRTGAVLDRLASEDARVKVIHQPNCGAYQARLHALQRITSPYFGFVDADDTIEPDMYGKMLAALESEGLDAVQCRLSGDSCAGGLKIIDGAALVEYKYRYLVNPKESSFIWDKLYRNRYDFAAFEPTDNVTNFDDFIFNLQFFCKVERIGFLEEGLYHYNFTSGSAARSFGARQRHDFLWMARNHYRLCRRLFSSGEYSTYSIMTGHIIWFCRNFRNVVASMVKSWLGR